MNKRITKIIEKAKQNASDNNQMYVTSLDLLYAGLFDIKGLVDTIDFSGILKKIEKRNERYANTAEGTANRDIKESKEFQSVVEDMKEINSEESTVTVMLSIISRLGDEKYIASRIATVLLERYEAEFQEINAIERIINQDQRNQNRRNNLGVIPVSTIRPSAGMLGIPSMQGNMKRMGNTQTQNPNEQPETVLEEFGENLSTKPRRNSLINREAELQRLMEVLLRRDKPNPILTGKQGVGKTAIVHELAVRIAEGNNIPIELKNTVKSIYSVEISTLLAGSTYRGEFEAKLKAILEEAKNSERSIIIYIDEIHTMMRAGVGSDGALDAANIIKPYLTDGSVRIIGSTTTDEYRRFIEKDKALERRFRSVEVEEPSVKDAIQILNGIKTYYEDFHHAKYTDEAIKSAVELSSAHIHDKCLPDKAIDLIDEAGAKISANKTSADQESAVIDVNEIEEVLQKTYKIPKTTVSPNEAEQVKRLEDNLSSKIFGQDAAVQAIIKRVKLAKAGIRDKTKPIANLLFVGPTGTGKTEISKVLAESLDMKLIRFDMSEYTEEHTVAKLFGSPAGYVGYDDGGLLTNAVRSDPNCVLLLDEIEKAHPKVYNALLQIMDYGIMTDSKGSKVDFRNAVLIMTSNAGAAQMIKKGMGFGKNSEYMDESSIDAALKNTFAPEFRARLTDVEKFNDLTIDIAKMIVKKEVDILVSKLTKNNIKLKVTDSCIAHIAEIGYTPMVGAREIKNIVSNDISNLLVDDILFGSLKNGGSVTVDWSDEKYSKRIRAKKTS